jgi:hypothetical protein
MRQKSGPQKPAAEQVIKDIRRATRKHHSAEDKIRIVLEGLLGEESIAALCRREGIAKSLYYSWSRNFWKLARSAWLAIRRVLNEPGFEPVERAQVLHYHRTREYLPAGISIDTANTVARVVDDILANLT